MSPRLSRSVISLDHLGDVLGEAGVVLPADECTTVTG